MKIIDQSLGDTIVLNCGSVRELSNEDFFSTSEGTLTVDLELGCDPAGLLNNGIDCFGVH